MGGNKKVEEIKIVLFMRLKNMRQFHHDDDDGNVEKLADAV